MNCQRVTPTDTQQSATRRSGFTVALIAVAMQLPPGQLDGRYSMSRNSMSGGSHVLTSPIDFDTGNNTFLFRKDGTFAKRVGKDQGKGTFEIDGYQLKLKYDNGKEVSHTVYIWPAANYTVIGIDKKPWYLEFRTPSLSDKEP